MLACRQLDGDQNTCALASASDSPAELAAMRHQLASLDRVGELLAEGDVAGAEHKLQTVPQTAPLLRTSTRRPRG